MEIVSTIPERCKRCYSCVRECPAKAIKVEGGQATVIEERCIACGNCLKVCVQKAKRIRDSLEEILRMIQCRERIIACLAPSFPAAFPQVLPGKVISGLRSLGFEGVWDVSLGAELVARELGRLYRNNGSERSRCITSPCPAVVGYVEKYLPNLSSLLAPLVSPMLAVAKVIRHELGHDLRIVFIGPCIAKKKEILDPAVLGIVDAVLTYDELMRLFAEKSIDLANLPESGFDGPSCHLGRAFPMAGGLLLASGLSNDILEYSIISTEGKERVIAALQELKMGTSKATFFDLLFCEGCIDGPKMLNNLSVFTRKEIITDYIFRRDVRQGKDKKEKEINNYHHIDLHREFIRPPVREAAPAEEEIARVLEAIDKYNLDDRLDCGACGYKTCREKAIAVCQGLAELEMCLPYLVDKLEKTCHSLQVTNQELASAQERLFQTEKLASMGQLSAGVAHEINNPLGTILLYSHALLSELKNNDLVRDDLIMIVKEATRCRDIVRGLLNFARQGPINKAPTDLQCLIEEVLTICRPQGELAGVKITGDIEGDLPLVPLDAIQIKQMLVNLVNNGIDAIPNGGGEVGLEVMTDRNKNTVEIRVKDNGQGIPQENLTKLFTPFFTTKALGRGTGLGLAIAYGIVKMHSGEIHVESKVGKGTNVIIKLPLGGVARETIN